MKISDGYIVKEITGNYVLIPAGQNVIDYKNMLHVNETGAFILECLKEDISYDELLNKMAEKYEASEEEKAVLKADLDEFLEAAQKFGAVCQED